MDHSGRASATEICQQQHWGGVAQTVSIALVALSVSEAPVSMRRASFHLEDWDALDTKFVYARTYCHKSSKFGIISSNLDISIENIQMIN